MNGIKGYIGNIFCIYIIMSVLENVISNEKYARYMKLFAGVVMIIVVAGPILGVLNRDSFSFDGSIFSGYEISDDVYASILNAEKGRNDEIINLYCDSVADRVRDYLDGTDYELASCDVRLDLDEDSESYGKIVLLDITLVKSNGIYAGTNADFYDYSVVTLKNNLVNFYNIPLANIYINIYDGQDNKEGIGN